MKVKSLSRVRLFAIPWTVAYQASQSVGFSRQEYWSGLPFPSPGDLPNPGIEPRSPALQADALASEPPAALSLSTKRPTGGAAVALLLYCRVTPPGGGIEQNFTSVFLLWELNEGAFDSGLLRIHLKPGGRKGESIIMKYPQVE